MHPYEFKILRRSLGLAPRDVAQRMEISVRNAQYWESENEPKPDAQAWILGEWGKFADRIAEAMEEAEKLEAVGQPLQLKTYRDELECLSETGLSHAQHAALTGHIIMMCTLSDFDFEVVEA